MAFITSWRIKDRQRFFAQLLPERPFVYDVGANYGEYTAAFLSLGARSVVALEPQADLAGFITESFAEEVKTGKLVVRVEAVGAKEGAAKMYNAPDPQKSMATLSTVFVEVSSKGGRKWDDKSTDVKVTTLDFLIKKHGIPDYIKIDVEGFDLEVLKGLSSAVPLISFEYNTQPKLIGIAEECIKQACSLSDYEFNYQAEKSGQAFLQFEKWVSGSVMRYTLLNDLRRVKVFGDIFARRRHSE